jgi:Arc/MetJ family transcription regulator
LPALVYFIDIAVIAVYSYLFYTHRPWKLCMRTNIDIDDKLMAQAQKACGHTTKKQTVEEALRLMIRLRQQKEVASAFGKYAWRGDLAQNRKGRGTG